MIVKTDPRSTMEKQLDVPHEVQAHADTESLPSRGAIGKAYYLGLRAAYWPQLLVNSLPLLIGDLLALGVSLGVSFAVAQRIWPDMSIGIVWLFVLTGVAMPATFVAFRLYPSSGSNAVAELRQIALATTLLYVIFLISAYFNGSSVGTVLTFVATSVCLLVTVPMFRGIARVWASRFNWWGQPVIVFGGGETARRLYNHYLSNPHLGIRPVAIIDDWSDGSEDSDPESSQLSERVESLRRDYNVHWAVVTTPLSDTSASMIRSYFASFPQVLIVPDADGLPIFNQQMIDCAHHPGILITNTLLLPLPRFFKACMDYLLTITGGLICLPVIAFIALCTKLTSRGPIFYSQSRIGKGNRPFRAWKFRTMVVNADEVLEQYLDSDPKLREEWEQDHKLKHDPRVTGIGHFLRKTSLDELPQIWNILRGEMSLVGPRPIVTAEIPKYGNSFRLYSRVTPGITGLWQVSGRNNTTYDQRVAFDRYYVLNWSPWFDVYILARTIKVVLCHEGAY